MVDSSDEEEDKAALTFLSPPPKETLDKGPALAYDEDEDGDYDGDEEHGREHSRVHCLPFSRPVPKRPPTVIDRHDWFASSVAPKLQHAGRQRELPPLQLSTLQASSLSPRHGRSTRTLSSVRTLDTTASVQSARLGRSCGVPVRPWLLPRGDPIPDRVTGKVTRVSADRRIRIFVHLPSGDRVALQVVPEMPIGPPIEAYQPSPLEKVFGRGAEDRGWSSGPPGRATPVRQLLAQRHDARLGCDSLAASRKSLGVTSHITLASEPADPEEADSGFNPEASLKNLVEAATGVSVDRQKLMFRGIGELLDHNKAICDYDIGHGALIYLSVRRPRRRKGSQETSPKFLAGPVLAGMHEPDFISERVNRFARERVGAKRGADLATLVPTWQDPMLNIKHDHPEMLGNEEPLESLYTVNTFDLSRRTMARIREHAGAPLTAR